MAFPNTLFPLLVFNTVVSDSIDIDLIKTLIPRLGGNHFNAMKVVAFLLWLERSRLCVNAVYKVGDLYRPDDMLDLLANQVVALLEWLENDTLEWGMLPVISLIEELCDQKVGIVELHQRSSEISEEMPKILEEMRQRGFKCINGVGFAAGPVRYEGENQFGVRSIPRPQEVRITNADGKGSGSVYGHREGQDTNGARRIRNGAILPDVAVGPRAERKMRSNQGQEMGSTRGSGSKHPGRRPFSEELVSVLLSRINVTKEEAHVPYDDRTVFLTFSRGYPVTERELREFFTRRFGNFIKAIRFQEVRPGVQPLFARMVVRNTSVMPLICDVNIRTKYIINGKHVWAKKFVKKPPPS